MEGTGEGGWLTKEDVRAAAGAIPHSEISSSRISGMDRSKQEEVPKVDFGRTKKVMWRAMGFMGNVPHFGGL